MRFRVRGECGLDEEQHRRKVRHNSKLETKRQSLISCLESRKWLKNDEAELISVYLDARGMTAQLNTFKENLHTLGPEKPKPKRNQVS